MADLFTYFQITKGSGFTMMIVTSVNCRSSIRSLIAVGVTGAVMARCTVSGVGKIHTSLNNVLNALRNDSPPKKKLWYKC